MTIEKTKIAGAHIIRRSPIEDGRGSFVRMFCKKEFEAEGMHADIAQINMSHNNEKGSLRGLHYQKGAAAEDKLVACLRGQAFDVCVDIREGSQTFGQWVAAMLTPENGLALYVPKGCAHGYLTLAEDTDILYFSTQFYDPDSECGCRYDDPAFGIEWPLPEPYIMSQKDKSWPLRVR